MTRPDTVAAMLSSSVPRALHPGAWWLWAIGMAAAVSMTTNPLLLLVAIAVLTAVTINLRLLLYSASLAPPLAQESLRDRLAAELQARYGVASPAAA